MIGIRIRFNWWVLLDLRDNDRAYKYNFKTYYDDTKGAIESTLCVGDEQDEVLIRIGICQQTCCEFLFSPAKALEKQGNFVVIKTPTGERFRWNSHLKQVYNESQSETSNQGWPAKVDNTTRTTTEYTKGAAPRICDMRMIRMDLPMAPHPQKGRYANLLVSTTTYLAWTRLQSKKQAKGRCYGQLIYRVQTNINMPR